jgi:retinol dehydrogenase 14
MAGRTVLVTGGTSGIGKATAVGLATMGAHLAITGRDRARSEAAAREIRRAAGGQVDAYVADLSAQSEVRRLADEVLQALPGSMCWSTTSADTGTLGTSPPTASSARSP